MIFVTRNNYIEELNKASFTLDIKVLTGVRRCGKSTLLEQFRRELLSKRDDLNIISIDLQDLDFEKFKDYHYLHEQVVGMIDNSKHNMLFIDEVQLCENFELAINSLHSKKIVEIFITGSNAFLQSSDIATLFTGRTIEFHILPFSFKEYSEYNNSIDDLDDLFDSYIIEGGLPGAYVYNDAKYKKNYVNEVFETIVVRDLVEKNSVRNENELLSLCDFLMDNISNITSTKAIENYLKSSKKQLSINSIDKYIDLLCKSFLFYECRKYDIKGKKYLSSSSKYYLSDISFRAARLGSRNYDFGRIYENIVYLELVRRGYDVYVGKLYNSEVDFVAKNADDIVYVQVADDISNKETLNRELSSLMSIHDNYRKIVLARTHHATYTLDGVEIIDIPKWLIGDS